MWVKTLTLQSFRNYSGLEASFGPGSVVLVGPNGAGKTNILEALSLLAPGKGMRKAAAVDYLKTEESQKLWSVAVRLEGESGAIQIGTGIEDPLSPKRLVKINGAYVPQVALYDWIDVVWQTPATDRLFLDAASTRRKFLDKLVAQTDPDHTRRIYRHDHALRERMRLLKEGRFDQRWMGVLEETLASEGVALVASRRSFLESLNVEAAQGMTSFPKAHACLVGGIEDLLNEYKALEVEEQLLKRFFESRAHDAKSGVTHLGAHTSNLVVSELDFRRPAEVLSTGEQKALLLSLMMAHCRLLRGLKGQPPLLLLDEVVAHLDPGRRSTLFQEILSMNMQAWLTGTEDHLFKSAQGHMQFVSVLDGTLIF